MLVTNQFLMAPTGCDAHAAGAVNAKIFRAILSPRCAGLLKKLRVIRGVTWTALARTSPGGSDN